MGGWGGAERVSRSPPPEKGRDPKTLVRHSPRAKEGLYSLTHTEVMGKSLGHVRLFVTQPESWNG